MRGENEKPQQRRNALENKTNLINQIFAELLGLHHVTHLKSIRRKERPRKVIGTLTTALYYVCLHNHTHKRKRKGNNKACANRKSLSSSSNMFLFNKIESRLLYCLNNNTRSKRQGMRESEWVSEAESQSSFLVYSRQILKFSFCWVSLVLILSCSSGKETLILSPAYSFILKSENLIWNQT